MRESNLPIHWRFAAGQAFAGLLRLVRSFDFLRLADGHTYVGVEPDYLIQVIDGFLGEPEEVMYGGGRVELQRLRRLIVEQIRPAYEHGRAAGRREWHDGARVYGVLSVADLHQKAIHLAPEDGMIRGWFAEGFCFAYSQEEFNSIGQSPPPP